jgi:hypothetical protein
MDALDRFDYYRRRIRKKLGCGKVSIEAERHISHAASIEQTLEMSRHEIMLGRRLDADSIRALREQLAIELMSATITASKITTHQRTNRSEHVQKT